MYHRTLLGLALVASISSTSAVAQQDPNFPTTPQIRIETGAHTAVVKGVGADRDCLTLLTGGDDKTARIWSVPPDGGTPLLLRTLRPPIGDGDFGKIYTVDLSPDGALAAVSGWTRTNKHYVMLFDANSGRMITELGPLENVVNRLAFSRDGRYLAAALGQGYGIHVWEKQGAADWRKVLTDTDFAGRDSYGVSFGPDNRVYAVGDDGTLRRYSRNFKREVKVNTPGGREPYSVAVHPSGRTVAIGHDDTKAVEIYDAETLRLVHTADATGVDRGNQSSVAWSRDGQTLWAAGTFSIDSIRQARAYGNEGRGRGRSVPTVAENTVRQIISCRDGIALATADPGFGIIDGNGRQVSWQGPVTPDMRRKIDKALTVSSDGLAVRFGLDYAEEKPVVFDIRSARLTDGATPPSGLSPPRTSGLNVTDWKDNRSPKLNGQVIKLTQYEDSRSLAVSADGGRFVLGTSWNIRAYDRTGKELWRKPTVGTVWGVNMTAGDTMLVAALGDGTIRWFRMSDGAELLALFVHAKDKRWVAWTTRGYYMASDKGDDLIDWHQNRAFGQAASFAFAAERRAEFQRPDIVRRVFAVMDENQAIDQQ